MTGPPSNHFEREEIMNMRQLMHKVWIVALTEDVTTNPRAVGLLFAGSSTAAIANPIDEVLVFLGATMVGN